MRTQEQKLLDSAKCIISLVNVKERFERMRKEQEARLKKSHEI